MTTSVYDLDYTDDSEVWDNQETCTYKSRQGEDGPFTNYTVIGTQWFMIKKDMLPPNSPLLEQDLSVELPGRSLNPQGINVKSNDVLQRSDGTQWIINIVELPSYVDRRVYVRKATQPV